MADTSLLILKSLVSDEQYCRKVLPFLKPEYFDNKSTKCLYKIIFDFISKYNTLPNKTAVESSFAELDVHFDNLEQVQEEINSVFSISDDDKNIDKTWLIDQTEKWCKDRALYLAIFKAINIIDGKDKQLSHGAIPDLLSKALGVSFDRNIGHDYFENAEARYDFYHRKEDRIPFDIELLNKITKGGITKKTLNIIMAPTGAGKSLALCHFSANMLAQGKNVLYITLEMAEERIAERIDANLFDIDMYSLGHLTKIEYSKRLFDIKKKSHGKLIVKEYPTAAAHVGHFRALIDELKLKKNFVPDAIVIDYLNICASSRIRSVGGSVNTYSYVKAIAEEVRGLAIEYNVPIFSATQTNRCLSLDTILKTSNDSTKALRDIKIGDKILSSNKKFVTVKHVFPKTVQDVYLIKTKSGKTIKASKNHVFPSNMGLVSIENGLNVGTKLFTV